MYNTSRVIWADITRIMAIFLVMVVHATILPTQLNPSTPLTTLLFFILAKTCVPLFVMLSGAFLLNKVETYQQFIRFRLVRLLLPWITWTIVFSLWSILSKEQTVTSFHDIVHIVKIYYIAFWFLPMIFGLYLLTPIFRQLYSVARNRDIALVIMLWFITVSLLPYMHNTAAFPLLSDNGLVRQVIQFSGYFLLGGLTFRIKTPSSWAGPLLLFLFGIVWTIFAVINQSLHNKGILVGYYLEYLSPSIVISTTGLYLLCMQSGLLMQKRISGKVLLVLQKLSEASLGIYFIHHFFIATGRNLFEKSVTNGSSFLQTLLMALFLFVVSAVIIVAVSTIPGIKKFVT